MAPFKPSSKNDLKNRLRNNKNNKLKKNKPDSDSDSDKEVGEEESEYETVEESSDSSYKPPKSNKKKVSRRRIVTSEDEEEEENDEESIGSEDSEDEEDEDEYDSDDSFIEDDEPEVKLSAADIQKAIAKIFPSRYMNEKVKKTKESEKKSSKKVDKKSKKSNKKRRQESESDEEDEEDEDEYDSEDEEDEDDYDEEVQEEENDKVFILSIGGGEDEDDDEEVYNDEDDRGECDSDDEKTFMKENYETVELPSEHKKKADKKSKKEKAKKEKANKKSDEETSENNVESEYVDLLETKKQLTNQLHKKPKSKILLNAIEDCNKSIKKLVKKARIKNAKAYHKLIHEHKKNTDEVDYFKKNLSNKEQLKVMKDLKEINRHMNIDKPYRLALLESKIPAKLKAVALQKLNVLKYMDPGDNEYYKIKNWVDTFMRIPFGVYKDVSVKMDDGIESCHSFMQKSKDILDDCVYGLNDAKLQILQMVGQWISNPGALGTAIAIKGPMGTGKCHGFNTEILMYDGTIKYVQDVEVGDLIMGDDSTPRTVLSLGRGQDEMFDVISNIGHTYSVNSEHILCLKISGLHRIKPVKNKEDGSIAGYKTVFFNTMAHKFQYKTFHEKEEAELYLNNLVTNSSDVIEITVKEYFNLPDHIRENLKGYTTGVEFEAKPVLFDPYIIGVWLGDGTSSKPMITNKDASILSYVRNELKKDNLNLSYVSKYDYNIVYDGYNRPYPGKNRNGEEYENKNIFTQTLKHYDLFNNKHIPDDYKLNSREVRLQILAGLIDTDGFYDINNNYYEITQKSKVLSNDIVFLARSLGFCATQNECEKYCIYNDEKQYGIYYRVNIYGENMPDIPTKCPRKQAQIRKRHKNALVHSIKIVPKGRGNYYGFELDDNHRYVLGNFMVTHNTSLVKEGISKILGREFAFIALGGAGDSSFLDGHSYTYEGSTWGRIVQILIDCKCMNPVIYFDELDKVSDTPRGEEIIGILTHLTDTSQNSQFHDKYFADVDFDLSKCLFIFSYNDESKVNAILRDRMYRIQTKGYETKEKQIIARDYLLPKIREQVNFKNEDVIIPDDTIQYIASSTTLTSGESGVRNMKRCLEIIYTKLNLFRLVKPESNIFNKEIDMKVSFPFTVTRKEADKLIKVEDDPISKTMLAMYC